MSEIIYKSVFGFTIGPIYEMMSHSKKTREMWFSSYLFSFYMRNLYAELKKDFGIIIPQIDLENIPISKAGFFPDHIIGSCKEFTREEAINKITNANEYAMGKLKKIINDLIEKESKRKVYLEKKKITRVAATKHRDVSEIIDYYLETNFICMEYEPNKEPNEIVEEIEKHLYALECKRIYTLGINEKTCSRCKLLPSVVNVGEPYDTPEEYDLCPFCFAKLRAHNCPEIANLTKLGEDRPFQSVGEISAGELKGKYPEVFIELSKGKIEDLNEYDFIPPGKTIRETELKNYHKYIAIIQADGDSLGKIINETKKPKELSEKLFNFSLAENNILGQFGAVPVYLGGDDLLIFTPLNYNGKTVLDLAEVISNLYSENVKSSISFGINVFYYKSPLSLALDDVYYQLNHIAKKEDGKNSLALLLTQHSGQKTALKFKNESESLKKFNKLLKGSLNNSEKYPEGIHHNLMKYKKILINLTSIVQLKHFKENRFNEDIHETFGGLELVFEMLEQMLIKKNGSEKVLKDKEAEIKFNEFISQLRFIKFFAGDKS
jgi:CRISPR-associated protein Cmr2